MDKNRVRKKNDEAILEVEEFGVLCMTRPYKLTDNQMNKGDFIYTSKEAYLWSLIISYLIKETEVSEKDINVFLQLSLDALTAHYRSKLKRSVAKKDTTIDLLNNMLFYSTRHRLDSPVFESHNSYSNTIEDILDRLQKLGLVKEHMMGADPDNLINVMSIVPLSFTKRTKLGESMLSKLNSMMGFYEKKNLIEESDFRLHYKFYKIWRNFKSSILDIDKV